MKEWKIESSKRGQNDHTNFYWLSNLRPKFSRWKLYWLCSTFRISHIPLKASSYVFVILNSSNIAVKCPRLHVLTGVHADACGFWMLYNVGWENILFRSENNKMVKYVFQKTCLYLSYVTMHPDASPIDFHRAASVVFAPLLTTSGQGLGSFSCWSCFSWSCLSALASGRGEIGCWSCEFL